MANVQKITNSEIIGMAKAVIDFNSVMASAEKKGYIENLAKVNDQVGYVIKAYEGMVKAFEDAGLDVEVVAKTPSGVRIFDANKPEDVAVVEELRKNVGLTRMMPIKLISAVAEANALRTELDVALEAAKKKDDSATKAALNEIKVKLESLSDALKTASVGGGFVSVINSYTGSKIEMSEDKVIKEVNGSIKKLSSVVDDLSKTIARAKNDSSKAISALSKGLNSKFDAAVENLSGQISGYTAVITAENEATRAHVTAEGEAARRKIAEEGLTTRDHVDGSIGRGIGAAIGNVRRQGEATRAHVTAESEKPKYVYYKKVPYYKDGSVVFKKNGEAKTKRVKGYYPLDKKASFMDKNWGKIKGTLIGVGVCLVVAASAFLGGLFGAKDNKPVNGFINPDVAIVAQYAEDENREKAAFDELYNMVVEDGITTKEQMTTYLGEQGFELPETNANQPQMLAASVTLENVEYGGIAQSEIDDLHSVVDTYFAANDKTGSVVIGKDENGNEISMSYESATQTPYMEAKLEGLQSRYDAEASKQELIDLINAIKNINGVNISDETIDGIVDAINEALDNASTDERYQNIKAYIDSEIAELEAFYESLTSAKEDGNISEEERANLETLIENAAKTDNLDGYGFSTTGEMENALEGSLTLQKYDEVVKDLEEAKAEIEDLKKQLAGETDPDEIARLEQELAEAEAQIEKLEAEKAELEAENESLKAENAELKNQIADLQGQVDDLNSTITDLENTITELESENADLLADYNTAKTELENAKQELVNQIAKYNELVDKYETLEGENANLKAELENAKSQLEIALERVSELENQLANLENNRDFLESLYESITGRGAGSMTDEQLREFIAGKLGLPYEPTPGAEEDAKQPEF